MIIQKTVFETEDGKQHATESEALVWDFRCKLVDDFNRNTSLASYDCESAVDYLLQNYTVVPK